MHEWQDLLPLITFIFTSSITPGPNNIMLTSSGTNYGFIKSVPHILGVTIGIDIMLISAGLGLGAIFVQQPILKTLLKYLGTAYLLYLAWRISRTKPPKFDTHNKNKTKPLTIFQAAMFQVINIKSWITSITCMTAFSLPVSGLTNMIVVTTMFTIINLFCISFWTYFGMEIRKFLKNDASLQVFNLIMAALTIASVVLLYLPIGCPPEIK